jgi:hypothetical protein
MINRELGFLVVVRFGSTPFLLSRQQTVSLSSSFLCRRSSPLTGEEERWWGGAKSNKSEKAWFSIMVLNDESTVCNVKHAIVHGITRAF